MATETDAARDRVLAARARLGEELETLEASARAAIDIPARVRRSPARAAAIASGAGFVLLGGPKRLFGAAKRAVFGPPVPLPKRMLPDEIEKTLRDLGDDGDKVRGALERDFATYARAASRERDLAGLLTTSIARPLLSRGAKAAAEWIFRTDQEGFQAKLAEVRARAEGAAARRRSGGHDAPTTADDEAETGGA